MEACVKFWSLMRHAVNGLNLQKLFKETSAFGEIAPRSVALCLTKRIGLVILVHIGDQSMNIHLQSCEKVHLDLPPRDAHLEQHLMY